DTYNLPYPASSVKPLGPNPAPFTSDSSWLTRYHKNYGSSVGHAMHPIIPHKSPKSRKRVARIDYDGKGNDPGGTGERAPRARNSPATYNFEWRNPPQMCGRRCLSFVVITKPANPPERRYDAVFCQVIHRAP